MLGERVVDMYRSSHLFVVGLVALSNACSSNDSTNGSGSPSNAGGGSNGGSANGTSGNGGTTVNAGGTGLNLGGNATFCVIGSLGCLCDVSSSCATGLVCTNNVCCDALTSTCAVPPPTGVGGNGTVTTGTGGSSSVSTGTGGKGAKASGTGGSGVVFSCVPGVTGPVITDCGYPYASSNPLTSVAFNESEVLAAIAPSGGAPLASVRLYYGDEHALTLGVRSVVVTTSAGDTTTEYPVSPLLADPSTVRSPQTGTNQLVGDQSGLDPSLRPMWPALFVTDITDNPDNRSGDWQQGGRPYNPNVLFGTWKAAVRNVDTTVTPSVADITPDPDPAKNDWNLGGGDPVPAGLAKNEGYGAEVRWDLVLIPGHSYRMQVIVHDGDQNKVGGDSGEACVDFCADAACPEGSPACGPGGLDPTACPDGAECWNGCCLTQG